MTAGKMLLVTPIGTGSGYGQDGLGLCRAFAREGWDVYLQPLSVQPPIPPEVAALLCKDPKAPFDLILYHADPESIELTKAGQRAARWTVAWTMWEFPNFDHAPKTAEQLAEGSLDTFDLVLGYDAVTLEALEPYVKGRTAQLQGGYWSDELPHIERDWSGTFRFGMVGQLHDRKNPFAAIRAFAALKEKHGDDFDAELHLKTNIRTLHPGIEERYPGVKIHYAQWSRSRLLDFYATLHCLVAPSRGEGKNLPALEAMTTGIPVIATAWGGHAVWLSEQWAYPLDYTIEKRGDVTSATADEEHLAELMWRAYSDRGEAKRKGDLAARTIPAMCDWTAVTRRFMDILRNHPAREPILTAGGRG